MTKRTIGYSLALAAVLMGGLGTAAMADRGWGMSPMHDVDAVGPFDGPGFDFAAIDADKDGKLTQAEVKAFRAARIKAVDADGNGTISEDELVAFRLKEAEAAMRGHAKFAMTQLDVDGDGAVSVTELQAAPNPSLRIFERVDTDGDGAISQAELDAAKARMAEMRERGGHEGREGKGMRGHGHKMMRGEGMQGEGMHGGMGMQGGPGMPPPDAPQGN